MSTSFKLIISVVTILITIVPVIKFWFVLLTENHFQDEHDLLAFTVFRLMFDIAVGYLIYRSVNLTDAEPSLFPFFLFVHLVCFAFISFTIALPFGVTALPYLQNTENPNKRKQFDINNRLLKLIYRYYDLSNIVAFIYDFWNICGFKFCKWVNDQCL